MLTWPAHEANYRAADQSSRRSPSKQESKAFFTSKDAKLAEMQARLKTEMDKIETDYSATSRLIETTTRATRSSGRQLPA